MSNKLRYWYPFPQIYLHRSCDVFILGLLETGQTNFNLIINNYAKIPFDSSLTERPRNTPKQLIGKSCYLS